MTSLRIGSYFEIEAADNTQPPNFGWKEFYNFRNHVLRVLRKFGTAGPMGEVDLSVDGEDDDLAFDDSHVRHPDFFVVDDMYNSHDRISVVECNPILLSQEALQALVQMAWHFPKWCVQFSLGDSGLRIYSDTILFGGRRFWDATTLEEIADRCSLPIDYGEATVASDSVYKAWLEIIGGEFKPLTSDIESPERQWVEALRALRHLADKRPRIGHSRFAYKEIRHDLHPETRRQLVTRLLGQIAAGSIVLSEDTTPNLQEDIGEALISSSSAEAAAILTHLTSAAQRTNIDKCETKVVMLWWANILYAAKAAADDLRRVLVSEMFCLAADPEPRILLSGIFGLAQLRVEGRGSLIDDAVKANTHWVTNEPLMKWLGQLRTGLSTYPDQAVFSKPL